MKRSQSTDDTPEDLRWQRLADSEAVGEASGSEAEFVRAYRPEGDATRAEQELLAELRARAHGAQSAGGEGDEALIAAAVGRFLAAPIKSPIKSQPTTAKPPRWRPIVLIGGLTTGLAAAASWLILASPMEDVPQDIPPKPAQIAVADPSPTIADKAELSLLRGPASRAGRALEGAGPLALGGGPLELGAGACVGIPAQLRACAQASPAPAEPRTPPQADAKLTIRSSALVLERGRLEVEIEAAAPEVGLVLVRVAGVALLGDSAGVATITHSESSWELKVEQGSLQVEVDGEPRRLVAGDVLVSHGLPTPDQAGSGELAEPERSGDAGSEDPDNPESTGGSERRRPTSDPRELLGEAQSLRGATDYRRAARTYRRLIREHGDTSIARTAQASLGQLYLGPLQSPAKALRAFRAYLRDAPAGAMAEEALRGEIDALRQLGKDAAANRTSADFLRRFPRSGYAERIRRDLEADAR